MLVFLSFLPPLMNFGLVTLIPNGIRVLGVEHPKNVMVQGRKAIRRNSFLLDVLLFTASFIILFIFSYFFALSF